MRNTSRTWQAYSRRDQRSSRSLRRNRTGSSARMSDPCLGVGTDHRRDLVPGQLRGDEAAFGTTPLEYPRPVFVVGDDGHGPRIYRWTIRARFAAVSVPEENSPVPQASSVRASGPRHETLCRCESGSVASAAPRRHPGRSSSATAATPPVLPSLSTVSCRA